MPSLDKFLWTSDDQITILESLPPGIEFEFCPTGEGGGVDPTCSPGGAGAIATAEREARGGTPSTEELYSEDGKWDKERVDTVHADAIAKIFGEKRTALEPGEPVLYMTGGGMGSGKSSLLKFHEEVGLPAQDEIPKIDPDEIKGSIPEYAELKKTTPAQAATLVHEESSYIGKQAIKEGLAGDYDMIYDTSGDSSIEAMAAKVAGFRKAGAARIEADYVFPGSIEEAIARSDARAKTSGRYVPHPLLRANHKEVSKVWQAAAKRQIYDKLDLWSTAGPQGKPPTIIATAIDGEIEVFNKAEYKRFVEVGRD